jgi:hypothetical protein
MKRRKKLVSGSGQKNHGQPSEDRSNGRALWLPLQPLRGLALEPNQSGYWSLGSYPRSGGPPQAGFRSPPKKAGQLRRTRSLGLVIMGYFASGPNNPQPLAKGNL